MNILLNSSVIRNLINLILRIDLNRNQNWISVIILFSVENDNDLDTWKLILTANYERILKAWLIICEIHPIFLMFGFDFFNSLSSFILFSPFSFCSSRIANRFSLISSNTRKQLSPLLFFNTHCYFAVERNSRFICKTSPA